MPYDKLSLDGRVAVVIGGTSGIGRTLSLGLAEAGAHVVPSSRRLAEVESTAAEIEAKGRKTLRAASDVLDRGSLEALKGDVLGAFGRVDVLINCAGRTQKKAVEDVSDAEFEAVIDTNLTGTF